MRQSADVNRSRQHIGVHMMHRQHKADRGAVLSIPLVLMIGADCNPEVAVLPNCAIATNRCAAHTSIDIKE